MNTHLVTSRRAVLVGVGVLLILGVNGYVLTTMVRSRRADATTRSPADDERQAVERQIAQSPHGRRVAVEIARVSSLTLAQMQSALDDEWTTGWSGAQDGAALEPLMDFPQLLACRLRRRFIQEVDQTPPENRDRVARTACDEWITHQRTHFEEVLDYLRDNTRPRPRPRGDGLRLAVATGLFCCARWSTTQAVLKRVESIRSFGPELRDRLNAIPGVPDGTKKFMPRIVVPDRNCLISVVVYAARRDQDMPQAKRRELDELLSQFAAEGLRPVTLEWNAWDAKTDSFDITPLKVDETYIDRRPRDESIDWFKYSGTRPSAQDQMLGKLIQFLTQT